MSDFSTATNWDARHKACREMRALGFTTLQSAEVYAFIAREATLERAALSIIEIAYACKLPFSTVSRIVGDLYKDKLVKLSFDDNDRRRKYVVMVKPKAPKAKAGK